VSLLVGHRVDGRVRHEQMASLGSIKLPLTIDGREAFWVNLHQVITRLGNRIGGDAQAKVFGEVHARIPMVTPQERNEYEIELATQEQRVFDTFREMLTPKADGNESLASKAMAESATDKRMAEDAAKRSAQVADRIARLKRGEQVANGKALDFDAILREAGWTPADMRHAAVLASLPETAISTLVQEAMKASERAERAIARRMARQK
jgi:hypothetical protein